MLLSQDSSPRARAMYLRTLPSIRQRCTQVHDLAKKGQLQYFDYDPGKEDAVIEFCAGIIERDYANEFTSIPPHGRWRHLDAGRSRIEPMLRTWDVSGTPLDAKEKCKRVIDLFLVSVLLDAGAGNQWTYTENDSGQTFSRSEGLGVASVHMFEEGLFSGSASQPYRVDAEGLAQITVDKVTEAMQVSSSNPMVGLEGRTSLLVNLSTALKSNPQFFGDDARPGNMLDFLEAESKLEGSTRRVHISALWAVLIEGLSPIWPARLTLDGVSLGDVWSCSVLKQPGQTEGEDLVPFHKLTGWITYSLIEPMEKLLGWVFDGLEDMTGLPEYRNGGLLVDFGVLTLRPGVLSSECYPDRSGIPRLPPSHPAVVEWRAMTVIELDRIADAIRRKHNLPKDKLTLAQVLESATWKGGREIAKKLRPSTGGPPIDIVSDGTVF
ncbi:hypothetical protein HYDPIDRAFT_182886 [Hydnomerulius pinastri MD-312]|uniref:Uracil catabolism protein 4 n=1 Tax=Hydnomerulius pinastri MD-312 TaxID=994086 RepID=A0A0C9VVF9_9AGAM|nr:hypothetical protein HYDPIDRAFT_182886 [Hydnomerulius pinastri MD-312]